MHSDVRWVASVIATLALILPASAWGADAPVSRIAVTADVRTSAVFADTEDVIVRGAFTEVGVRRGDAVVADRTGVREVAVGEVQSAAVLSDRIAFAVPRRLVLIGPQGRRRTVRAPWRGSFPALRQCRPWVCFAVTASRGRLEIGAFETAGRLRWRRVVADGAVVADGETLVVVRGRQLARYAPRDGRSRGTMTLASTPLAVALAPGRLYVAERRRGHVRVQAYTRAGAVRAAATTVALDGPAADVHLQAAGHGVLLQGPLRRLSGHSPFDVVLLSRSLKVRRSLRSDAPVLGERTDLIAFDAAAGTIRSFDAATGRVGAVRRVAMEDRSPLLATGRAGTVVWDDYGSPTPVPAEGLAIVNVRTGAIRPLHLIEDSTGNLTPIARAGGRTWTTVDDGLVGIDDQGGTVVPNVDFPVTALAAHGSRAYVVTGEPQRLVAIDAVSGAVLPFAADTGCATCIGLALAADDGIVAVTTLDASSGAVAVRAFDAADGHLLFQRRLPLAPWGVALSPDAVHIVGTALDGKATSSLEVTLGRDGVPRGGGLRLAPFFEPDTGAATAFGLVIIPGLGQVVIGELEGRGPAAGACGAVLTDPTGTILRRWRPCLGGLPFSVAAIGRRVVIGYAGGLEVYDLP